MGKWSKKARERQSARLKGYWKAKSQMKAKTTPFGTSVNGDLVEGSVKSKVEELKAKLGGLIEDANTIINQLG